MAWDLRDPKVNNDPAVRDKIKADALRRIAEGDCYHSRLLKFADGGPALWRIGADADRELADLRQQLTAAGFAAQVKDDEITSLRERITALQKQVRDLQVDLDRVRRSR